MKIFSIYHVYSGLGLTAVVIANTEAEAIAILNLQDDDIVGHCCELGPCTDGTSEACIVASESF